MIKDENMLYDLTPVLIQKTSETSYFISLPFCQPFNQFLLNNLLKVVALFMQDVINKQFPDRKDNLEFRIHDSLESVI